MLVKATTYVLRASQSGYGAGSGTTLLLSGWSCSRLADRVDETVGDGFFGLEIASGAHVGGDLAHRASGGC